MYRLRGRFLRSYLKPRHDKSGRLHRLPVRRDNNGLCNGIQLRVSLHDLRARLLWICHELGHGERGRLHGLPGWHHHGGRCSRKLHCLSLHRLRAGLLWRRDEPGHSKRRRLLGLPSWHLFVGRQRLQRVLLHVLPRGHHDRGRGNGLHVSFGLCCLCAELLWERHEPGNDRLLNVPGGLILRSCRHPGMHPLPCRHNDDGRRHRQHLRYCLHDLCSGILWSALLLGNSVGIWLRLLPPRNLFSSWKWHYFGLHNMRARLLRFCDKSGNDKRSRLHGLSDRHHHRRRRSW